MPPTKRFEGKFGIPASHPVESLLTSALYRLPESVNIEEIERIVGDITSHVNKARESEGLKEALTEEEIETLTLKSEVPEGMLTEGEIQILTLKLVRHYEDNGDSAQIDIARMVDALLESPKFLRDDRGSIEKLFQIHEMKTLQKIAEIRKRRAEITEGFNPYENLFETASGQYYLAHLLNMPHLEDESEYMKNCVGTSTSYINKVKRGEVEIFSFRDKSTDKPVVTIEYDTRSHRLLQVKKYDDDIPTLTDSFAPDLVEAIELINTTENDKGETRAIANREIVHLRQLLGLKDKKEPFTRDELRFLYEVDEKIQGFGGVPEPLIAELLKDRNIEEDMLTIFECTEDQIAHEPKEITQETKAYVGQLELGIFQKLPATLQHVYTSFPESKIRRAKVQIGGKSKEELTVELKALGIVIPDRIKSMMDNPDFVVGTNREEAKLVRLSVASLGFKTSATTDQIYERVQSLGLELCPPDTGPNYLLQYKGQPFPESIKIGMKPISVGLLARQVAVLELMNNDDEGLSMYYSWAYPDRDWSPEDELIFRVA